MPPSVPDPLTPAQERERRARWYALVMEGQASHRLLTGAPPELPAGMRRASMTAPAGCRFTEEQIVRVPVEVTPRGREALWRCHHEARLLPQALEEHFGLHSGVARIVVDACSREEAGVAPLRDPRSLTPPEQIAPHGVLAPDHETLGGRPRLHLVRGHEPGFPDHLHPDRGVVRITVHHKRPTPVYDPQTNPEPVAQPDDPPLPVTYPAHTFHVPLYALYEHHPDTHLPAMRANVTAAHLLTLYPHPPLGVADDDVERAAAAAAAAAPPPQHGG